MTRRASNTLESHAGHAGPRMGDVRPDGRLAAFHMSVAFHTCAKYLPGRFVSAQTAIAQGWDRTTYTAGIESEACSPAGLQNYTSERRASGSAAARITRAGDINGRIVRLGRGCLIEVAFCLHRGAVGREAQAPH
jgi:hypothetical protein